MYARVGCIVGAAAGVVLIWGAVAVVHFRMTWPYPRVLPGTVSYGPYTYVRQIGCHSRRWWDRHGGISGAEGAQRLGTLRSAVGVGALPEYGLGHVALSGYLLVPSAGCLVMYETNAGG